MPQIRGQDSEPRTCVLASSVGVEHRADRECVTQPVQRRPTPSVRLDPGAVAQQPERLLDAVKLKPPARGADEQRPLPRWRGGPVPAREIRAERVGGAQRERQLADLAELPADHDRPENPVEVLAVQADRFPDSDPGAREKADQGSVGRGAVRGAQHASSVDQREDLLVFVEKRPTARRPVAQQLNAGNLQRRINPVQIGREPADRGEPRVVQRVRSARQDRPPNRGVNRDPLLPALVEIADEPAQHQLDPRQLEPERATDRQIFLKRCGKRGHAVAPGHGRAICRSICRSHFA